MSVSELERRLVGILAADAVGYSRLMSLDESATVAALEAAREAFRMHILAHGGRVVDTAGDSVLAVFGTAFGAVLAAQSIQDALDASDQVQVRDRRLRFRVGVHVGDIIEKTDGTVYGDGVNIAARLQGLAPAGGICVSAALRATVHGKLAARLADRGEHRLKNIAEPLRVFDVQRGAAYAAVDDFGMQSDHPPAQTDEGTAQLPIRDVLIGRADDVAALVQAAREHHLVTVFGPGGVGKTAMALEASYQLGMEHGVPVRWADLAGISDPALVPAALSRSLRVAAGGLGDPYPALVAALKDLRARVILDNAEHLIDAVAKLARVVRSSAPGISLVITSQVPLGLPWEHLFRLEPLSAGRSDSALSDLAASPAVLLFEHSARRTDRRFSLSPADIAGVADLCRHLDGNALAIKLVSAQLQYRGFSDIASRSITQLLSIRARGRDIPDRQQTLRAALDWSCGLLDPLELKVWRRLGVFAGTFTAELASAIVSRAGDVEAEEVVESLATLVDRSLVSVDRADPPNYRLADGPRAYALELLDKARERQAAFAALAGAMLAMFRAADEKIWQVAEQRWLHRCEAQLDSVRQALDWSLAHDPALSVTLWSVSANLFCVLPLTHECRRRSHEREQFAMSMAPAAEGALYCLRRSSLHWGVDNRQMLALATKAARQYRALNEPRHLFLAQICQVGSCMLDHDEAVPILRDLSQMENAEWPPALRAMRHWAEFHQLNLEGQSDESRIAAERGLELAWQSGKRREIAIMMNCLITAHLNLPSKGEALRLGKELVAFEGQARYGTIVHSRANLARAHWACGQYEEARFCTQQFFDLCESEDWDTFGIFSDWYVLVALRESRLQAAAKLMGYADQAWQQIGRRPQAATNARAKAAAILSAELDPTTFDSLVREGGVMTPLDAGVLVLAQSSAR